METTNTIGSTQVCTRCGIEKEMKDFYQVKYKNQEADYINTICKTCAKIEQRRRYLLKTNPTSEALANINKLYEAHAAAGRSVPTKRGGHIDDIVQQMLSTYTDKEVMPIVNEGDEQVTNRS